VSSRISHEPYEVTSFEQAINEFKSWFSKTHFRTKEVTNFEVFFEENIPEYWGDYRPRTTAWWAIEDCMVWTLDETIANELLHTFNLPPIED